MTGIGNVAGFCLFLHCLSCRLLIANVRNYRREQIHPSKCDLTAFAGLMCNRFEYSSNTLVAQKNPRVGGFFELTKFVVGIKLPPTNSASVRTAFPLTNF